MPIEKNGKVIITKEDIDKIIPPKSRDELIRLSKIYEQEYEKSKQTILEVMKRNSEQYKDSKEQD